MRTLSFLLLLLLAGCGGGSSSSSGQNNSPGPPVNSNGAPTGPWEYAATSKAKPGLITYVEVNFGSTNAAVFQTLTTGTTTTLVGDTCNVGTPSVTVTVSGNSVSGSFTIGPNTYTFSGSVTSSSSATGTYSGGSGSCADSGTFQANQALSFNGNYGGQLTYSDGSREQITVSVTEGGSPTYGVTATGTATNISGADCSSGPCSVQLTGVAVGNLSTLSGSIGQSSATAVNVWLHSGNLYVTENDGGWYDGSLTKQSSAQGISGAWEFLAVSSAGATTLIEADITANGSQSSASGPNQIQTATYSGGVWYVNGDCVSASPGQNSMSSTVSGNSITLNFNEGGNTFTGQGTLNGNSISGTYSGSNPNCSSSGTFTGRPVPNLGGTFSGTLNFPDGADNVTATLTEGNSYGLNVQTTLSGIDNGSFTFAGSAVANVMFVSGSVNGNPFSLFGYFDSTGQFTGTPNSIAVFDDDTLAYYGLLVKN